MFFFVVFHGAVSDDCFMLGFKMRLAGIFLILLVASCTQALAQEPPVFVAIMEPRAVREYIDGLRNLTIRTVKFEMSTIVLNNKSMATASIIGPFDEAHLPIVLRTLALGGIVHEFDGPWKLLVTGDNRAIRIQIKPVARCSNFSEAQWLLSNQGNRWIVVERSPSGVPRLCEPVL